MFHSFRSAFVGLVVAGSVSLTASVVFSQTPAVSDGLARAEFDKPLSMQMTGVPFIRAFAVMSRDLGVPFVVDFDEKDDLRVTVVAKEVPARTILSGLATTYGLEFKDTVKGVVITRRGVSRPLMPIVVGEWPPVPNIQYDLQFTFRNPAGQTLAGSTLTSLSGMMTSARQGFAGESVLQFDRRLARLEPRSTGGLELAFVVLRETGNELQLIVELTVETPVDENTYSNIRTAAKVLAPNRETVLLKTSAGYEVRLVSWRRAQDAASR